MTSVRVSLFIGDVISLFRADDRVFVGLRGSVGVFLPAPNSLFVGSVISFDVIALIRADDRGFVGIAGATSGDVDLTLLSSITMGLPTLLSITFVSASVDVYCAQTLR